MLIKILIKKVNKKANINNLKTEQMASDFVET